MPGLVEYLQHGLRGPVLDVVVDGQGHALDGALQVGLRDGGVVDEDGGAAAGLFELPAAVRLAHDRVAALRQVHLAPLARHAVCKPGEKDERYSN